VATEVERPMLHAAAPPLVMPAFTNARALFA
jgi:hypothetical protein